MTYLSLSSDLVAFWRPYLSLRSALIQKNLAKNIHKAWRGLKISLSVTLTPLSSLCVLSALGHSSPNTFFLVKIFLSPVWPVRPSALYPRPPIWGRSESFWPRLIAQSEKEHKPHKYSLTLEIIRSVMQINKYIRLYLRGKECRLIQQKLPERMDFKGKWKLKSRPRLWSLKSYWRSLLLGVLAFGRKPFSEPHSKVWTGKRFFGNKINEWKNTKDNSFSNHI